MVYVTVITMWLIVSFMLLSIATVHTLVPIGGNMNFLLEFDRIQPYVNLVRQSAAIG
jgi:hypothetical protein